MAARTVESPDRRLQYGLLVFGAAALLIAIGGFFGSNGLNGRAWYGWWDANAGTSGKPFVLAITKPRPGGASALGGLRDGDLVDLRQQNLATRFAVAYQPLATRAYDLKIDRGTRQIDVRVTPSTEWEGVPLVKVPANNSQPLAYLFFAGCALLIALRRWTNRDARRLALVLCFSVLFFLDPSTMVVPNAVLGLVFLVVARGGAAAACLLLVNIAAGFGERTKLRSILELLARAAVLLGFAADLAGALALATVAFDPVPFIFRISPFRGALDMAALILVALCAVTSVLKTPAQDRPRVAWLILPLPLSLWAVAAIATLVIFVKSWFANLAVIMLTDVVLLLAAFTVTYALLKRRVLDIEFVLGRTLVVAAVSAIVVASFVLLEWLLGTVLAGVSHATGLVANAGLALALGFSLNAIHKRVDALVDAVLFRKRRDDERALLEFAKEAGFVTDREALLDQSIAKLERHTDARNASILLDNGTSYSAQRSYGGAAAQADENDGAILALKAWHKPVDPHHYHTSLRGALAVPMLSRGRLLGVLVLGERAGGESYAPDEIEALSQFAYGVSASLETLSLRSDGLTASLQHSMTSLAQAVNALAQETASLRTDVRGLIR